MPPVDAPSTDLPLPEASQPRKPDLAALIGSRICHDLISPLGAIGNGVELLGMAGAVDGPEMALITESVENAKARIRFFRVAFGMASADQRLGRPEIVSIVADLSKGARSQIDWQAEGDHPRAEVKAVFLALQCLETAMPYGGMVFVQKDEGRWIVTGAAAKLKIDDALFDTLEDPQAAPAIIAAQVQFLLLPEVTAQIGRQITLTREPTQIVIEF